MRLSICRILFVVCVRCFCFHESLVSLLFQYDEFPSYFHHRSLCSLYINTMYMCVCVYIYVCVELVCICFLSFLHFSHFFQQFFLFQFSSTHFIRLITISSKNIYANIICCVIRHLVAIFCCCCCC